MYDGDPVASELNVKLDPLNADFDGAFEGIEGVLRGLPVCSPVRDDRDAH